SLPAPTLAMMLPLRAGGSAEMIGPDCATAALDPIAAQAASTCAVVPKVKRDMCPPRKAMTIALG
ncbi:MAG TPA: hypothetical protein VH208_09275, partial [Myxococcaceae bacterium]|nr:hypothetical protein [Myxococcaceae bacterium]